MSDIPEIRNLSTADVGAEIAKGGRFVRYTYVISLLIITFSRSSRIHFVKAGQSRVLVGLPYTIVSLALGWWGFPWGIIRTPLAVARNLSGGEDVTAQMWQPR